MAFQKHFNNNNLPCRRGTKQRRLFSLPWGWEGDRATSRHNAVWGGTRAPRKSICCRSFRQPISPSMNTFAHRFSLRDTTQRNRRGSYFNLAGREAQRLSHSFSLLCMFLTLIELTSLQASQILLLQQPHIDSIVDRHKGRTYHSLAREEEKKGKLGAAGVPQRSFYCNPDVVRISCVLRSLGRLRRLQTQGLLKTLRHLCP